MPDLTEIEKTLKPCSNCGKLVDEYELVISGTGRGIFVAMEATQSKGAKS